MSLRDDARAVRDAIATVVKTEVEKLTWDCLRVRKAVVTRSPNGSDCKVQLVGDETELTLPYSSRVASVSVNSVVWVAILGPSMRNAIVWETANFR